MANDNEFAGIIRDEDVEIKIEEDDIVASLMEQTANSARQEGHIAIQVENEVAASLVNIFEDDESITPIPRVAKSLRKGADGAYDPRIVSIGPYHWGKPEFEAMEKLKRRFLQKFLNRKTECCLRDYVKEIESLEPRLRRCYYKDIHMSSKDFLGMMLVDGCFVVEFFLQEQQDVLDIEAGLKSQMKNDIYLLENQLPFFLLQHIYDMFVTKDQDHSYPSSFIQVVLNALDVQLGPEHSFTPVTLDHRLHETIHHILHLYHWLFGFLSRRQLMFKAPSSKSSSTSVFMRLVHLIMCNIFASSENSSSTVTIPSATELLELGVKFKLEDPPDEFFHVKFEGGVMEISEIPFDNYIVTRMRNMIALERFYFKIEPHFSLFLKFIDLLVNTSNDVALLRKCGIINHLMGSDEEVALLLNQLTNGILIDESDLLGSEMCRKVNEYCNMKWHRWRASFVHDYCSSPWKTIALVAAFILLVLTFVQSYMSLHSYFLPH